MQVPPREVGEVETLPSLSGGHVTKLAGTGQPCRLWGAGACPKGEQVVRPSLCNFICTCTKWVAPGVL